MKRFSVVGNLIIAVLLSVAFATGAKADTSAFSTVPKGNLLYRQLRVVQSAVWEPKAQAGNEDISATMTRYEFAINVARVTIDFNAHVRANSNWIDTVPRGQLRALRALLVAFPNELEKLGVKTVQVTSHIDKVLRHPAIKSTSRAHSDLSLSSAANSSKAGEHNLGLSFNNDLRFYAGLFDTAPQLSALSTNAGDHHFSAANDGENHAVQAGANMSVNDWLNLRAAVASSQRTTPSTLQQTLRTGNHRWFDGLGDTSAVSGGLDVRVANNLTLSGEVARFSHTGPGLADGISGTRLEGGLGISGLNNKLLLSAQLARLMPDDSASLAATAARLNLGYNVSKRLSLNLLYQQMFTPNSSEQRKSTFAGGVNINF